MRNNNALSSGLVGAFDETVGLNRRFVQKLLIRCSRWRRFLPFLFSIQHFLFRTAKTVSVALLLALSVHRTLYLNKRSVVTESKLSWYRRTFWHFNSVSRHNDLVAVTETNGSHRTGEKVSASESWNNAYANPQKPIAVTSRCHISIIFMTKSHSEYCCSGNKELLQEAGSEMPPRQGIPDYQGSLRVIIRFRESTVE